MENQLHIITTSLEALLQRGTNAKNISRDNAAIDAFCGLVNKEPECVPIAAKLIVSKMQSMQEWEALQALQLLDACMRQCGHHFQAEVGKFRFLNELIKLISPKYLGNLTPDPVRNEIIELLYMWTLDYPKETKIKEAYDMLKKQGVVQVNPSISRKSSATISCSTSSQSQSSASQPKSSRTPSCSILEDHQSETLQRLLQSKNPEDLKAANKLIKYFVSEEERKVEQRCKCMSDVESINNNISLLNEMLDNYSGDVNDLDLINELLATSQSFRPKIITMAQNLSNTDDDLFQMVISAHEKLCEVLDKFIVIIKPGNIVSPQNNATLLDMNSTRSSPQHSLVGGSHLQDLVDLIPHETDTSKSAEQILTNIKGDQTSLSSTNRNMDLLNDLMQNHSQKCEILSFTNATATTNPTATSNPIEISNPTCNSAGSTAVSNPSLNSIAIANPSSLVCSTKSLGIPYSPLSQSIISSNTCVSTSNVLNVSNSSPIDSLNITPIVTNTNDSPSLLSNSSCDTNSTNLSINTLVPSQCVSTNTSLNSSINVLCKNDVFSTNSINSSSNNILSNKSTANNNLISNICTNTSSSINDKLFNLNNSHKINNNNYKLNYSPNKLKALKDLDDLVGESLSKLGINEEIVNETNQRDEHKENDGRNSKLEQIMETNLMNKEELLDQNVLLEDDDQLLFDHESEDIQFKSIKKDEEITNNNNSNNSDDTKSIPSSDKLSDINVKLEDIVPSDMKALKAMEDRNKITILIHLTKTKPKCNIAVYVITTLSQHTSTLSNYLFQPVVPQGYKLKLQKPSSTSLSACNPFLPSPAITQIMLIASPTDETSKPSRSIHFKFVVSYEIDEETISEMGEIVDFPLSEG